MTDRKYVEGATRLIVERTETELMWMASTQVCTDGVWEDDAVLAEFEADTEEQARNAAIASALLEGLAPDALEWRTTRLELSFRRASFIPVVDES